MINKLKKIHYGWIIVFACSLVMVNTVGISVTLRGIFIAPIRDTFGYSATQVSGALALGSVGALLSLLTANFLYKRISTKAGVLIFGLLIALGHALTGFSKTLTGLCVASLILGISNGLGSLLPVSMLVSSWFVRRKSFVLGLAFAGSGIGSFIFAPIFSNWIINIGYANTLYIVSGIVTLLTLLAFFLISSNPNDKGLKPYGGDEKDENNIMQSIGLTFNQARKTASFKTLFIGVFLLGITISYAINFVSPLITDMGYSAVFAGMMVSVFSAGAVAGKILYGFVNDKAGSIKGNVYIFALWSAGLIFAYFTFVSEILVVIFALFLGFGCAIGTVSLPIWVQDLFGQKEYVAIYPMISISYTVGTAVGLVLIGQVVDTYGSYALGYLITGGVAIVAFVFVSISYKLRKHKY